jgi:anti-sigma factor RsiW
MTRFTPAPTGARHPIDCETAVRRLWDYLDGGLAAMARAEVEAHLAACALCPPHFAFARMMRGAVATSAPQLSTDEETRLRSRVRHALASLGTSHATKAGASGAA